MIRRTILTGLVILSLCTFVAADDSKELNKKQKDKLGELLKGLKKKAQDSKPAKYEVALPVATAGARGAHVQVTGHFAVMWPACSISPLTALAENLLLADRAF